MRARVGRHEFRAPERCRVVDGGSISAHELLQGYSSSPPRGLERGRGLGAKLILPADNDAFRDWFAVLVEQSASIRRNLQNLDDVKPLCAVEEDDAKIGRAHV